MSVRVALAVWAVVAFGSACTSDDPSASPLPTTSAPTASPPTSTTAPATPTSTSTPAPSPPAQPALARQDSPTGAEAFARYWLTTLDYAYKTGDTKPFRALGTCKSCNAVAGGIDRLYTAGGRLSGAALRARTVQTIRHVKSSAALVDLTYSRGPGRAVPGSGAPTGVPAENGEFLLALERRAASWRVISVKTVERR